MMTRRQAIKTTALAAVVTTILPSAHAQDRPPVFSLPPLPYALDALEPHIDARTMEIHHGKHHKAYVDNLNKAVLQSGLLVYKSVEEMLTILNSLPKEIPDSVRTPVRNNGGGHFNHSLFWQMMSKSSVGEPKAELAKAIEANFGSVVS